MIGHDSKKTYKAAIIGAGSGGLTMAVGLSNFGHDIVLIEGDKVGGDCTNVGCVPSKALLHAALVGEDNPLGWVRAKRDDLAQREDHEMEKHEKIHLVRGWAKLTPKSGDHHVVLVDGPNGQVEVHAENVIISGGSKPIVMPVEGLGAERVLTNENIFELESVPGTVVLVGGGAISIEMATAFGDLGSTVHIVELAGRLMGNEDPLVSSTMQEVFESRGMQVHLGTSIERFDEATQTAHLTNGATIADVDKVLIGIGRRPALGDLRLEAAGVETTKGGVVADTWGRTSVDGVYAVGDITGNTATTHGANSFARRTVRAIALPLPKVGDPRVIPNAVYSRPQIASVGLTVAEVDAMAAGGRKRYVKQLTDIDRGFTDDLEHGFIAVDVERFTGKILRAVIVGPSAAEMIGMFTIMIDHGIGLRKLFGTVHPYPSYSQAVGFLADEFATETFRSLPQEWFALTKAKIANRFKK
ncbi:dihydrolipoyl dehydrogenase family protein [Ilumatobacter sp.]|uniref:dihydrolipoyl dehydrogenase family protein n=1 Tax=Ilumatobacter sp. TaxID=1967498 RepID=UPI0037531544